MNKTININLGGIFFHVDEIAYQKLRKYLDAIRRSLSDDPKGKDEILTDIESRIGEILAERIKDVRQVVNEQDIEDIIDVMGKPEEYAGDEEIFEDETYSYSSNKSKRTKKLYRDASDKFLGGVSSGLAHYFGLDVTWVRLAWIILLIGGFSVILYPILWIILPEANSTSEKLEMEGEAVTISNIERKIKEEFNKASGIVKDGIDDVSNQLKNGKYQGKVRNGLQEIIDLFARVFRSIFKVGGKFIGIIVLFASTLSLIAILFGGFSLGSIEILGMGEEFAQYPPFIENSQIPKWLLTIFGFAAFVIPIVLLFMLGLKIISSNVKSLTRTTRLTLLGVWLIAVMGLTFAGIEYKAHDVNHFTKIDKMTVEATTIDTLNIKMLYRDNFEGRRYFNTQTVFVNDIEMLYGTNVRLDIRESNTNETYLKIYKEGFGMSKEKARGIVNDMQYKFDLIENNLLLDAYFLSDIANKYRKQNIEILLFVPKGKTVYFDKSVKYFLQDVDNIQDIYDRKMIKHHFKMTSEGLDCLDCKSKKDRKIIEDNNKVNKVKLTIDAHGLDMEIK